MFFQNARKGYRDWWLYLVTILIVAFGYVIGQIPMTIIIMVKMNLNPDIGQEALEEFQSKPDFTLFGIGTNLGFFLLLLTFVFAVWGLFLGVKYLHRRNFKSLISWSEKIDWNRIFWGFGLWFTLSIFFELGFYLYDPSNYSYHSPGYGFLYLLLISFFLLPVQTSFEEFFFRGYLMQAIGFYSKNKWIPFIVTSLLFTAVHAMNPEIKEYGLMNMLPYYFIAGLFLAYITIMDNRLELALGVHAATNVFGSLLVTYEGAALQTDTLFKTIRLEPLLLSLVFLILSAIFILFASKKYNWDSPASSFNKWEGNNEL